MPPPPQLLALSALGAVGTTAYMLAKRSERQAAAQAAADQKNMEEQMARNRAIHAEAEEQRRAAAAKKKGKERDAARAPENYRMACARAHREQLAQRLRELEAALRRKQVGQLTVSAFSGLPLVGRPEEPAWVLLFLVYAWGNPAMMADPELYELHLAHLTRPFAGGTTRLSAFSLELVTDWLKELASIATPIASQPLQVLPKRALLAVWSLCRTGAEPDYVVLRRWTTDCPHELLLEVLGALGFHCRWYQTLVAKTSPNGQSIMSAAAGAASVRAGHTPEMSAADQATIWLANFDLNQPFRVVPGKGLTNCQGGATTAEVLALRTELSLASSLS